MVSNYTIYWCGSGCISGLITTTNSSRQDTQTDWESLKKNLLGLEGVWSLGWSDFEKEKAMLCQIVEGPQIQNFMS